MPKTDYEESTGKRETEFSELSAQTKQLVQDRENRAPRVHKHPEIIIFSLITRDKWDNFCTQKDVKETSRESWILNVKMWYYSPAFTELAVGTPIKYKCPNIEVPMRRLITQ